LSVSEAVQNYKVKVLLNILRMTSYVTSLQCVQQDLTPERQASNIFTLLLATVAL